MAATKIYLMHIYSEIVFPVEEFYIIKEKSNRHSKSRLPITKFQFEYLKGHYNYTMHKRIIGDKSIKEVIMFFS